MNVDLIFSRFKTAKALGEAIGRSANRAAEMRQRQSIPVRYWPALIEAAQERGFTDITYESLAMAHASKATEAA